MIDLLYNLADDLATYVETASCEVDRVVATFGEPADTTGTNCKTITTWLAQVEPRNAEGCITLTRLTFQYRVASCYPIQAEDLTDDQHLEATDCLLELVNLVWCGLVADKDTGVLMGLGTCEGVTLGLLAADPPRGGVASYTGSLSVDYSCTIPGS